jgi:hypothetical protein
MSINLDSKRETLTRTADQKELVLWYDEAINIDSKIKSLIDICKISEQESINIALDSLLDGSAKITTGNHDRLIQLQEAFQKKLINTTIE